MQMEETARSCSPCRSKENPNHAFNFLDLMHESTGLKLNAMSLVLQASKVFRLEGDSDRVVVTFRQLRVRFDHGTIGVHGLILSSAN
jgi:hypothetical protein